MLSNHDVVRHATRYGGGPVGLARARAATLAMLALPGSAYLYQGEELGLENVDVPEELRQDPAWLRTHRDWRDGCRVPIPWSGDAPPYGFGPGTGQPWLPQPLDWADRSVAAQEQDPDSTLAFYKAALAARRKHTSDADRGGRAPRRGRRRARVHPRRADRGAQRRRGRGRAAGRRRGGRERASSRAGCCRADTAVWLGLDPAQALSAWL